jgi:hypothetical protein
MSAEADNLMLEDRAAAHHVHWNTFLLKERILIHKIEEDLLTPPFVPYRMRPPARKGTWGGAPPVCPTLLSVIKSYTSPRHAIAFTVTTDINLHLANR